MIIKQGILNDFEKNLIIDKKGRIKNNLFGEEVKAILKELNFKYDIKKECYYLENNKEKEVLNKLFVTQDTNKVGVNFNNIKANKKTIKKLIKLAKINKKDVIVNWQTRDGEILKAITESKLLIGCDKNAEKARTLSEQGFNVSHCDTFSFCPTKANKNISIPCFNAVYESLIKIYRKTKIGGIVVFVLPNSSLRRHNEEAKRINELIKKTNAEVIDLSPEDITIDNKTIECKIVKIVKNVSIFNKKKEV